MATASGTATDFLDFYTKLIDFATTGLGADNWTQVHGFEDESGTINPSPSLGTEQVRSNKVVLKGPGSGGTDEIFVGLFTWYNSATARYNVGMQGLNAYDNAKLYDQQTLFADPCYAYSWDQAIGYWFVGNGRRIIAVFKMGTVYQVMYLGFMLPYATPVQYPYPLLIGGNGIVEDQSYSLNNSSNNCWFYNGRAGGGQLYGPSNIFFPIGAWWTDGGSPAFGENMLYCTPWDAGRDRTSRVTQTRECLDGCYLLTPIEIHANGDFGFTGVMGAVDSMFHISGFNNFSENTVDVGGVTYMVFQNAYRTDLDDFIALKWE